MIAKAFAVQKHFVANKKASAVSVPSRVANAGRRRFFATLEYA